MAADAVAVGVDVGGTSIKAAVVLANGDLVEERRYPTPHGFEAAVDVITTAVHDAGAGHAALPVGVAVPAIVDETSGRASHSANLGWGQVDARARLQESLGRHVTVSQDIAAAGRAELAFGAGSGARLVLIAAIGTGIGAAMIGESGLHTGARFRAGEIGHVVVDRSGPPCACGGHGCLECYAAAPAIAAAAGKPDVAAVVANLDDPRCAEAWNSAIEALSVVLSTSIALVDPDLVIIGGGVANAGAALFDPLRAQLADRLPIHADVPVVAARLGDSAAVVGAATLASKANT